VIYTAEQLAQGTGGRLVHTGPPGAVCTDTRKITPGDWFLALRGENFDAHNFLDTALNAGACGVIAERVPHDWSHGLIQVEDGLRGLQALGRYTRQQYDGPVVGITGSAGKTTTRAMAGLVLEGLGPVHQTSGNLNNHIGLPLTLLAAPGDAAAWVVEMGMNHTGEIALLQDIATPTVRIITNVGPAHLEGLGTIEAVARAKGELFDGARSGDTCCINSDDPMIVNLPLPSGVHLLRFGSTAECDVQLINASVDPDTLQTHYQIETPSGRVMGQIDSPGLHLAHNLTAAIAVGTALGVDAAGMDGRIARYAPVGMRLRTESGPGGIRVINDAYNANPMSMAASLRTLAGIPASDGVRRVALLGDMLELGPTEIEQHAEIVNLAERLGLELIGLAGTRFKAAAGARHPHAPTALELAATIRDQLRPGDIVLLKGSRGMAMEHILSGLMEETA